MSEKGEWNKIEGGDIFKFEKEGDAIEGKLVSVQDSKQYDNKVYKIQTKDGLRTVFGTVILDDIMQQINVGKEVQILYTGEKENPKKGQNALKLFEVFVR